MPEQAKITAEMYEVEAEKIPFSLTDFDSLIGRAAEADILMSVIPCYNEFGSLINFPELSKSGQEFIGVYTSGSAVLFAGEAGNGKKTLDSTLLTYVVNRMRDLTDDLNGSGGEEVKLGDRLKCYILNGGLSGDTKEATQSRINSFFDGIDKVCEKDEKHALLFISLGDITLAVKKKRNARLLSERVKKALCSLNSQCVITARIETAETDIPDCLGDAFTIMHLSKPSSLTRREYLNKFTESYPAFALAKNTDILVEETEDFSFRMLKQFTDMLLMTAKGRIASSGLKLEDYMGLASAADTQAIGLDAGCIDAVLEAVRNGARKNKAKTAPVYIPAAAPIAAAGAPISAAEEISDSPASKRDSLTLPDSFSKIDEYRRSLKIPSTYTPPGYTKRAEDCKTAEELIEENSI